MRGFDPRFVRSPRLGRGVARTHPARCAEVVDEAYNRTLLVTTPEGAKLWINGAASDLHGCRRED